MNINKKEKIKFIVKQEKQHLNDWKWIYQADSKTIDDLYDYWNQEISYKEVIK